MANMYPSKLASGSSAITFPKLYVSATDSVGSSTTIVENNNYSEVTVGTVRDTLGSGTRSLKFYDATTSQIGSYTLQSNHTYTIPNGTVTIRFDLSLNSSGQGSQNINVSNVVIS